MKKELLTLLLLFLATLSYSQSFKEDPNFVKQAPNAKGYMLDTVSASALKKDQLYSNALAFLSNRFKDSRSIIESKDLDLGEISFKGNTQTTVSISDTTKKGKVSTYLETVKLFFKCKIYLKDQKFKIVLYSLEKPFTSLIASELKLPIDPFETVLMAKEHKAASDMALNVIKDLAASLNKKPENDF